MASDSVVEIVRRAIEAAIRRPRPDFATVNALYHPDHEFVSLVHALEGRVQLGAPGFREWRQDLDEIFDAEHELEDLTAIDEHRVLAVTRTRARGKAGGVPLEFQAWNVVTVRDGLVVRTEVYPTQEEAFEAAGLAS